MQKKITSQHIFNFIEGNTRMFTDSLGFQPQHIKEQVAYRLLMCKDDCVKDGYCKHCQCPLPNRAYATDSCNKGERFPDLMKKVEWDKYKEENGIK